jgi:hypothetical protein
MIITHKLNIRWFGLPHLPSGTEMLHLSGTLDKYAPDSIRVSREFD